MNKQAVKQRVNFLRERLARFEEMVSVPIDSVRIKIAMDQIMFYTDMLRKEVFGDDSE